MFRCVIVAAVSTTAQASDQKASIPQQVEACREVCEARDWRVIATIEIPGHSRNYNWLHEIIRDCPGYGEMVRLVESSQVDLIVVRDYDRLWRTDALRAQIAALCREHRVQIFSLNQPVEPEDPVHLDDASDSRLIVEALSGIIGQQENKARARRHRLGMAGRIRRGLHHPGPNPPYGYRYSDDGRLLIDSQEAPWVRHMFSRYLSGVGPGGIASELTGMGIPTPGSARPALSVANNPRWHGRTIVRILQNAVYAGEVHWGEFQNPDGVHEALVSREDFVRTQRVRVERGRFRIGPTYSGNLLRGLLSCGFCHHAMVYYRVRGRLYLRCSEYVATRAQRCQNNGHSASAVHRDVMVQVQTVLREPEVFMEARRQRSRTGEARSELQAVESELEDAKVRSGRWNHLYEHGQMGVDELLMHRQRIFGQIDKLRARQTELKASIADESKMVEALVGLAELTELLPDLSDQDLREKVYMPLIRKVVLKRPDPLRIAWW